MISVLIATSDKTAGGIQRALVDQLALLGDEDRLDITILSPASDFAAHAQKTHQTIIYGGARRLAFRHIPSLASLSLPQKFSAKKFDVALCHNGFMAKGLKAMAKKVIGICHNDKPQHFTSCDRLVCLTPEGIRKAISQGWNKAQLALIPHYHEATEGRLIPVPNAPLTIGAAGRMVAKKNLSLFIEIAAIVKKTHPEISFHLGGTGPLEPQIKALNQANNNPVTLLGWTDFTPFLARLDMMVIPSTDEPFGYIFPEAMEAGLALLSTPTFGAHYCLEEGRIAPLYPADDAASFAAEICRLADDRDALHAQQIACYQGVCQPRFHKKTALTLWQELLLN